MLSLSGEYSGLKFDEYAEFRRAEKVDEGMVRENLLTKLLEYFQHNSFNPKPIPETI